jgi:hypothetical protein
MVKRRQILAGLHNKTPEEGGVREGAASDLLIDE